jgi:methyl-accepting chemotaxis protein
VRQHWPWVSGLVAGLLLLGAVTAHTWYPRLATTAHEYDMVTMLKDMAKTNRAIGETNQAILQSLNEVNDGSARVSLVASKLNTLQTGMGQQLSVMASLQAITQEQASMSQALERLTASVEPSTASLVHSAADQATMVEQMGLTTSHMAVRLAAIGGLNQESLTKLNRAEALSAVVLSRMP